MRNPYCMGFDRETEDLYIGDVGQGKWEEVNHQLASSLGGENYEWRLMEGPECFTPSSNCDPGGLTDPVYSYNHSTGGRSVIGGYPYRGKAIPFIEGHYIFADTSGIVETFLSNGNSLSLVQDWASELSLNNRSSFEEDGAGELYYTIRGSKTGSTGVLHKILPTDRATILVDFNATGLMKGNPSKPFNTVDLAVRSVDEGGLVEINSASPETSSDEQLTIDRAMTLTSLNCTIQIGTHGIESLNGVVGFVTRP